MTEHVAFLGTGLLGGPMVTRLLHAGHRVGIWNRTAEKMQPLVALGAAAAASPAAAVQGARIVCFCLTDADAITELLFGPADLAVAIPTGALVVDFSTIGPKATRALAERLQAERPDLEWIDAPVSGGVRGAQTGELVVMCGGEPDAVTRLEPVLAVLAKRVCRLGPTGSGQAAKLCNQLIVAANIAAIAEAMNLGREHGLDMTALPHALAGGWADSLPLQIIGPRMAQAISEPPIVSIATYVKDLALVLESAGQVPPLGSRASEIFTAAAGEDHGAADVTALLSRMRSITL